MGFGKSKKQRRRNFRENQKGNGKSWGTKNKRGENYAEIIKENAAFEGYYKLQKIVPEDEWESFLSHMREPLPTSWRISGHKSHAKAILKIIEGEYFKALTEEQAKPECLPWYPEKLAWQINMTRKDIRKSEANVKLHQFLLSETEAGNISRQEAVSMIPPLVLDVQSHHKVLDMCAAPGSKTTQLIEMLHSEEGKIPDGFVIANDENNKRCYMLVHQLKRLQSPNVIITNHDATVMPNILTPKPDGGEQVIKFDRILCDVPCSGDGTMRKNFDVWMKWNTANSSSLHGIQYRIARRGVEMLAVDGKMVYSTCSLNPIEDEAIVHRLLVAAEGALELIDVSDKLPGLKYSRGLSHWTITARDLTPFNTPEDVPEDLKNHLREPIFPPKAEDAEKFHLDRCIRVLPHQQNTGGFFVAALKKIRPLPWEAAVKEVIKTEESIDEQGSKSENAAPDSKNGRRSPARKKRKFQGFKEEPYFHFTPTEEIWPSIKSFYGISDELDSTLLFSRCNDEKRRNLYFTNPAVRDIIKFNFERMIIINSGVKMFTRSDNKGADCGFRVAQEGATIAISFISKRRVLVTPDDLIIMLSNDDQITPPEIHTFSSEARNKLHEIDTGSILVECKTDDLDIVLVAWKGKTSVRAYVPKSDRIHYLRLCGGDVSKFEVNKFAKDRVEENENGEKEEDISDSFNPDVKETNEDENVSDSCNTALKHEDISDTI